MSYVHGLLNASANVFYQRLLPAYRQMSDKTTCNTAVCQMHFCEILSTIYGLFIKKMWQQDSSLSTFLQLPGYLNHCGFRFLTYVLGLSFGPVVLALTQKVTALWHNTKLFIIITIIIIILLLLVCHWCRNLCTCLQLTSLVLVNICITLQSQGTTKHKENLHRFSISKINSKNTTNTTNLFQCLFF